MKKSFSVIIPTLNEENYISGILTDINIQSITPKEIIVVDGFSKDQTKKIVKNNYPNVRLLSCPPNVASQRNYGAKFASGKLLFFLDADTRLPDNSFFQKTIEQFNNQTIQIACPFYLPYKSNPIIFFIYLFFNLMFFIFQKISASGAGSSIVITKKLFIELNGFNQNIKFEDIELIRRASKKANFKMLPKFIWVSDRRFKKYGIIRTTIQYLTLSVFFLFNQFNQTAGFTYQFGKYNKKTN